MSGYLIEVVHKKTTGQEVRIAIDKAKRDAKLYSAIVRQHRASRSIDAAASCLLVSSAKRLVEVEKKYRQIGEPNMVISVSMVVYLLSLVPGVSIGLGPMAAFLFGERRFRFSSDLERTLIRVVHDSKELDIPWARRTALIREVKERLLADARKAGEKTATESQRSDIEREAIKEKNMRRTVEVLRESLDAVAVESRTETENIRLKRRIKELEDTIRDLKGKPKR